MIVVLWEGGGVVSGGMGVLLARQAGWDGMCEQASG